MRADIRAANASDAGQIAAIYAPYVRDTAISFEVVPPTTAEMRARIRAVGAAYPWLVAASNGAVLGYAYAGRHSERAAYQWSVNVSVYIHPDHHRRGIGRALYTALLGIVTAQGFYRAYGGITLPNASSIGLHETMGFRPLGVYHGVGYKLGAWHDVGWWELTLQGGAPPPPPRSLAAMRRGRAWNEALAAGRKLLR
jgi:phosphinothricin acetyltransferase